MFHTRKKPFLLITIGSIISYLLFGLFDSLKGSTLSSLLEDLQLSFSLGGTIIMGQYAGYFAATVLAGYLTDYCGQKAALIAAGISLTVGAAGYSFSTSAPLLLLCIFFIGMGLGTLELVGCNIITEYYPQKKGSYLNILTAIAGVGAILSPVIAGRLLESGLSWRMVYRYGLILLIPATLYFFIMREPHRTSDIFAEHSDACDTSHCQSKAHDNHGSADVQLFQPALLLMYLVNFSYMAAEMSVATWLVDFYRQEHQLSTAHSTLFLSAFYIFMTVGRIIGSLFVERFGRIRSILLASTGAALCLLSGAIGPFPLALSVALTGLFYSVIFPTGTAVISSLPQGNSARIQGIYFACGGLGGMFGPWCMGIISDLLGLRWGMALGSIFCLSILLPMILLRKHINIPLSC